MAIFSSSYVASIRHVLLLGSPLIVIGVLFLGVNRFLASEFWTQPATTIAGSSPNEMTVQEQCIDKTISRLGLRQIEFGLYQQIWSLCGNEEYNKFYLLDFKIRRRKILDQGFDERVTLAMVVAITISGVLMSGLQLFMAYRIALKHRGQLVSDTELTIQTDRVALKSSMVGLAILVISLAFFVVYVKWIYTITEVPVDNPKNIRTSGQQLPLIGTVPAIDNSQEIKGKEGGPGAEQE
jgi:hypothetical protein